MSTAKKETNKVQISLDQGDLVLIWDVLDEYNKRISTLIEYLAEHVSA